VFTILVVSVVTAIGVSAMCSVFEAVLYSLTISQVELMEEKFPRKARLMKKMKENIDQPITAILTLNTIANTIGASIAGAAAANVFGSSSLLWFSLAFTLSILLFSEILPKTVGVVYARQLAGHIALPLHLMIVVLKPIIVICQAITRLVPQRGNEQAVSAREVLTMARLSLRSGAIEPQQETVIANILRLGNRTVRQVMTPRTVTFMLEAGLTIAQAQDFEEQWKVHSRIPVYGSDQDDILGLVLSRDLYRLVAEGRHGLRLSEIMQPVYFVPESAPLNRVFIDYFERHQHLFVAVDEYGSVTGVISMEDIIEEIIGREIVDESDQALDMRELARQTWKRPDTGEKKEKMPPEADTGHGA